LPALAERLLADFASRKSASLARAVSIVENGREGTDELLAGLHAKLGHARRIGITGPPVRARARLRRFSRRNFGRRI
jgi:LAO/AO transport system kinase